MGNIIGDSENPHDKYVIARIISHCVKELRELLDIKEPKTAEDLEALTNQWLGRQHQMTCTPDRTVDSLHTPWVVRHF